MSHFLCCVAHTASVLLHTRADSFGVFGHNQGGGYKESSPP